MNYYPLFANLAGRVCLAIGEGELIEEKANALTACGAAVRRSNSFDPGDARDAFLIVADVREDQAGEIAEFGDENRVFVNIVDKPRFCSFIVPAIVRREELLMAVSTSGLSPALAGWIREQLEREYGAEYGDLLHALGETREQVKKAIESYSDRKAFYRQLLDEGILETARTRGRDAVDLELQQLLRKFKDRTPE